MATEKRDIVIVDLDGTLADDHWRAELFLRGPEGKQWEQYFAAAGNDPPKLPIVQLVRLLKYSGKQIWILSGRSDSAKPATLEWLERHNVPFDHIIMRPQANRVDDNILKLQWVKAWGIEERIWFVLEDRQRMVDAWRAAGYTCLQVAPGNF